ncbi:MAG: proline dehydrogenase [Blastocatellia bacterium]|nr:MAG: proline dehydrogenase [Blastocatellia bacterium]
MAVMRKVLLAASTNAWLRERATKSALVHRSVSRFMPGERLEDGIAAATRQQTQGVASMLTRLGENLTTAAAAEEVTRHYLGALDRIAASGLDTEISVKPTQLGLDIDIELCFRNLHRLIDRAAGLDNFVWLDMESAGYVDRTLDLFRRARARSAPVGVALQAYLYRTERDVESLLPLGPSIRLVKGAYLESPSIAYSKKPDVDENYQALACQILREHARQAETFLQIATHDERLIAKLSADIAEHQIQPSGYEFAMLYGIQDRLQRRLVTSGRRLRVLISYGEQWFPWYMRRLAERPANMMFVLRNVFNR